jgi:methylated-DNA-[protein]-cysteine S-methyltransferase
LKGKEGSEDADPIQGFFIEPLGLYLLVERRAGSIRRTRFSQSRPHEPLPDGWRGLLLKCWLEGEVPPFVLDLSALTAFQRDVLQASAAIPPGETRTYGDLARRLGRPRASRATGQALSANPFPLIIPCHRVVAAHGLGGYRWGLDLKKKLLDLERGRSD